MKIAKDPQHHKHILKIGLFYLFFFFPIILFLVKLSLIKNFFFLVFWGGGGVGDAKRATIKLKFLEPDAAKKICSKSR